LLYPGLEPRIKPSWWQLMKLNLARQLEIVRSDIPIPLRDPELFTQSSEWQQFIANDPLAVHTVTSSFLNAGRELDRIIRTDKARITQPALLMLAGNDRIIDNQKTRNLAAQFGTCRLTSLTYPEASHTLEFEPDRNHIFADLLHWLEAETFHCESRRCGNPIEYAGFPPARE
jgi:acylglycerol lipase